MEQSLANFAQYFRIGLEIGLCKQEEARDWAISVIDRMDEPPVEIIEVSWRKPLAQLISDLNDVKGELQMDLVCRWLLGRLALTLEFTKNSLDVAIRQAKRIAHAAEDSDLYDIFDVIEDKLGLAEAQAYGTVAECRDDFDRTLNEYGIPPFSLHEV